MTKNDISVVIFSKNRPMQLEACISSFFRQCSNKDYLFEDNSPLKMSVLYKADPEYQSAYDSLICNFWNVDFVEETDFKKDLLSCVDGRQWTLFICDDALWTHKFNLKEITAIMSDEKDIYSGSLLGFSFRMGTNTTKCFPVNKDQSVPEFVEKNDKFMIWDWTTAELDFAYPLEVSSSMFATNKIIGVLEGASYSNPNDLEWIFYINLERYKNFFPYLMAHKVSVSFCNPCNKVQTVNDNRVSDEYYYDPKALLDLYSKGAWINIENLDGVVSTGAHMPYMYLFTAKDEGE